MDAELAMPALLLFSPLLVVLAVAWRQPVRRALVLAFIATLLLYLGVRALPELLFDERPLGEHWNWTGELLALAGVLLLARQLVRSADFS